VKVGVRVGKSGTGLCSGMHIGMHIGMCSGVAYRHVASPPRKSGTDLVGMKLLLNSLTRPLPELPQILI
jgi:hypothetical protein